MVSISVPDSYKNPCVSYNLSKKLDPYFHIYNINNLVRFWLIRLLTIESQIHGIPVLLFYIKKKKMF